jgi:hypothetical protein
MKFALTTLFISQLSFASLAFAHGPTPQKIDESTDIKAPIEKVWQQVSQLGQIAYWHPQVSQATMLDESTRVLTIKDKGTITESLDEMENDRHYMSYRLYEEDIKVFPVSFYTVAIELKENNNVTTINWSGRFYRADTGNFPPAEYSDEAAVKAMTDFATQGMSSLKAQLEKQ